MELFNGGGKKRILPICHYGHPVLEKVAAPIADITPEIRLFAAEMIESMYEHDGVGLAAPQVGESLRLITIDTWHSDDPVPETASYGDRLLAPLMPVALLNLEILEFRGGEVTAEEGCLSFPQIYGDVPRSEKVVFKAQLLDGAVVSGEADGLLARCLQHELDHLNGVVFPDRMTDADRAVIDKPLKALKKATLKQLDKQRQ
ncbi:MAG: peptide deformylase [Lentisphaeria bacterium]|nr:peptide deformylase [Lentisphaeria bacterium]